MTELFHSCRVSPAITYTGERMEEALLRVQLDDQVAEADQQPLGTAVQLLCSREDPTQCMLAEFPKRKGWFL